MTKSLLANNGRDVKTPALRSSEEGLRVSADKALYIPAEMAGSSSRSSSLDNFVMSLKSSGKESAGGKRCKRTLWLTFFFDGTGNNLQADLSMSKHSNIAKLFRAHKPTDLASDRLVVYIPGIGTYFPEIGDDGGGALGLGCGAKGEGRIDFAVEQLNDFLRRPLKDATSSANLIQEINVAAFGFSRGAALARAFLNTVMQRRCVLKDGKWRLIDGGWLIRFRFLGLFDTVASVGLTLSSNTTGLAEAVAGNVKGMIHKRLKNYPETRPEELAFSTRGMAGADPAPGRNNGHNDWGGRLAVHEAVEEVRHFIAAHEIRNSFPVDSISRWVGGNFVKPSHFYEILYPGAHSDVGGGYAPGEGAKSVLVTESLSLIPLRHMYEYALRCGVPLNLELSGDSKLDFAMDEDLRKSYDVYLRKVGHFATVGDGMIKHMKLFHAWRFRKIRRALKDGRKERELIKFHEKKFREMDAAVEREVNSLSAKEMAAQISLNAAIEVADLPTDQSINLQAKKIANNEYVEQVEVRYASARHMRLQANAKKNSTPNMNDYQTLLQMYDQQLLNDVGKILAALGSVGGGKRSARRRDDLRPYYKALLEVYESEIEQGEGLSDETVVDFFGKYVHDSLVGFARDATLPSDPRVVYLGGDRKYLYANLNKVNLDDEPDVHFV